MERKREEKMEGKGVFSYSPPPNFEVCADYVTLLKKNLMFFFGEEI